MTRAELQTLYRYNDWANERLLTMLSNAFGEETDLRNAEDKRVRAIQETATHIVAAQLVWRSRWEGISPTSLLDPADYSNVGILRAAFNAECAHFWAFFNELENDAALGQVISYRNLQGVAASSPLWAMMQHVLTHSAYHRGQVTGLLLDLNREDVLLSTDLLAYYIEQGIVQIAS